MKFLGVLFLVGLHFYSNFAFGASESKIDDEEAPSAITSPAALEPKILYSVDEDFTRSITSILEGAQYQRNLTGGIGGVHLFEGSGQRFLVKCSKDFPHMREEIMADVLYNALSVPVPKFFVMNTLPQTESFKPLNAVCPQGLYRISEFIEQDSTLPPDFKSRVSEHFLVDAFLANRDIAGNSSNVMARGGVLYRIDNGGALRYRSVGGKKGMGEDAPWASTLIPEVKTLPQGEGKFYDALTPDTFPLQAGRILEQAPHLFEEFKKAADSIGMPFRDQQDLQTMLVERLKVIQMYLAGNETFYASKRMPVTPSMAGGAFIIKKGDATTTDEAASSGDSQYYVLLGQRAGGGDGEWVTLGGKADFGKDFDIAHATSRELFEESNGLVNIPDTTLSAQTSHDLVRWNHRFRQYFLLGGDIDEAEMTRRLQTAKDAHSQEYHQFKWVPLEALTDSTTLANGFFDWNSERFDLFEPFRDLLQTMMVQKNLRDLATTHKLPEDQHTQSIPQGFADGDLSKLKIYRFPFESSLPHPQRLHEQELADQVIKKAEVLGELKSEREQVHLPGLSLSHYGLNHGLSPRNPYPFTASEGFLKLFLGKDYIPVISPDLDDVYIRNLQAFFNKSPAGFEEMPDDSFLNTLVQVLKKERAMDPHFQVFYHGTQGDIGYLYDIFTEFRQLLKGEFADNIVVMRSLDEAFKDINNVQDFIGKFAGRSNYTGNYQDMGLSVNLYLFGSPNVPGSSTLSYFYNNRSAQAINVQKFFDFLNTTLLGLNLQKDRYWRLFESAMGINPSKDGRLYQIFIKGDYVDSLVYAAMPQGHPQSIKYEDIQSDLDGYDLSTSILIDCSTGERTQIAKAPTMMNSLLDILKKRPDLFEKGLSGVEREGAKAAADLQARLFMKPQCMQRPHVSQTFVYHRDLSIDQNKVHTLKMQLRNYLREDLSRWFGEKYEPDSDVFHAGSLSTMNHFQSQYEKAFGQRPTFEQDNFNQKLVKIYETEDIDLFKQLLKDYSLADLLDMDIIMADSYRKRGGRPKKFIEKLSFLFKLLESSEGDLQKTYIDYVRAHFDWNKHLLNWKDYDNFDIEEDIKMFPLLKEWCIFNPDQVFSDGKRWAHIAIDHRYYSESLAPLVNVNLPNVRGVTPLEYAYSLFRREQIREDAVQKVIQGLLDNGAAVNQPFSDRKALLARAIEGERWDIAKLAVERGADVNSLLNFILRWTRVDGRWFVETRDFPVIMTTLDAYFMKGSSDEKLLALAKLMIDRGADFYKKGVFRCVSRKNKMFNPLIKSFFQIQGNIYDLSRFEDDNDHQTFIKWLEANPDHGLRDVALEAAASGFEEKEE